jgi:hypothetical protein
MGAVESLEKRGNSWVYRALPPAIPAIATVRRRSRKAS